MLTVLRDYQVVAVEALRQGIREKILRQVLRSPTGSGKTEIAAHMMAATLAKSRRAWFLCERLELIEQTSARLKGEGLDHGVIQGRHLETAPAKLLQVACLPTVLNRPDLARPDVVFVDECDQGGKRLKDYLVTLDCPVIGLSATPYTRGMGKTWQRMVSGPTTQELIDLSYLKPVVVWAPFIPDLTGVKVTAGEWQEDQLAEVMDKPKLVGDIVETWLTKGENRQTLGFAVNVAHSKHLVARFQEVGVSAEHVDGYMALGERTRIIDKFRWGEIKMLWSVNLLGRGFDVPSIGTMIFARPIRSSLALHIQFYGRGMRCTPGLTDCIVLDHSGNTLRLGLPTDPLPDVLDNGEPIRKVKKKDEALPKPCPKCKFVKPPGARKCPACGFETQVPNEVFAEDGELHKVKTVENPFELYAQIEQLRIERNVKRMHQGRPLIKPGWTAVQFKHFTGEWPPDAAKMVPPMPASAWVRSRVMYFQIKAIKGRERGARV